MKRRLPTIRPGRDCVGGDQPPAAHRRGEPPRAHRHHPGKAAAAANAAPTAASANRPASAGGRTASPPSSTASAANATPSSAAARPEPAHPAARGRVRHPRPFRRRAHPAPAAGHLGDHRADRLGHIQPPGQRERRQQRVGHPARRRTAAAARTSSGTGPPPGHAAGNPTRTSAARHTTGRPGEGTSTSRPAATYASTASGHGHTMATGDTRLGSLPAIGAKRRRGGIPHVQRGHQILARPKAGPKARSSKSTAGRPAGTLRESGRQQPARTCLTPPRPSARRSPT